MASLIIENAAQVASPRPGLVRGGDFGRLWLARGESILIEDGVIEALGPIHSLRRTAVDPSPRVIDASGRSVIPGLVDCHSHLIFAGNRVDEFALRAAGAGYERIAAGGGGIAATVRAVREADKRELKTLALERLDRALAQGTTTMEVKTGYGLDAENELKMLEVAAELDQCHSVDVIPTFLGAHAVPKGVSKSEYLALVREMMPMAAKTARFCDVFCEQGYFDPGESIEILELAREHGMLPKMHADQFHSIGCVDAALALDAVSIDHLEALSGPDMQKLAASELVGVFLPGVSLFLDIPFGPARAMAEASGIIALATDFNPGSNMSLSLQLVMSLGCMRLGLSPAQALACATLNAARALGLDRPGPHGPPIGAIAPGFQADLLLLDVPDYREMIWFYGENHVHTVVKKGRIAWSREKSQSC